MRSKQKHITSRSSDSHDVKASDDTCNVTNPPLERLSTLQVKQTAIHIIKKTNAAEYLFF